MISINIQIAQLCQALTDSVQDYPSWELRGSRRDGKLEYYARLSIVDLELRIDGPDLHMVLHKLSSALAATRAPIED